MAIKYSTDEADLTVAGPVIQELWVRNLIGHEALSARAKLHHGYIDNPAGPGTVLVLRADGTDAPQGTQGLHPRSFYRGSQSLRAAGLADYVVNPEHRTLGPALMLLRRADFLGADRFDLTYGLPNAKAAPVFSRAGLTCLGNLRRYAKVLGTRDRLADYVPGGIAGSLSPIVDVALRVRDRARVMKTATPLACRPARWEDDVFDDLWSRRPPVLLLAERSGRMLRWRFGAGRQMAWNVVVAEDERGCRSGYLVWRTGQGFARVGDFFTVDPATMTLPLLLAFSDHVRRTGQRSISLEFFGSSAVAEQLRGAGMVLRAEQVPVFVGSRTPLELQSPELWYLTEFDNDGD